MEKVEIKNTSHTCHGESGRADSTNHRLEAEIERDQVTLLYTRNFKETDIIPLSKEEYFEIGKKAGWL